MSCEGMGAGAGTEIDEPDGGIFGCTCDEEVVGYGG